MSPQRRTHTLLITSSAFSVLFVKLWLIARFANPIPFWDQWGAEGILLYPRYLRGELTLADLLSFHNEHRIFWSRLLSLATLLMRGHWSPPFQMVANAILHSAILWLFLLAIGRHLTPGRLTVLCAMTVFLFSVPFGYENTLNGFHSPWYFVVLFAVAAVYLIVMNAALTWSWWVGILALIADHLSAASGAMTPASTIAICLIQII